MHPRRLIGPAWALAALLGTSAAAFAAPMALDTRSTEAGGVAIAIKPVDVGPGAERWRFEVSLSSDRGEIRDDVLRTAVLLNRATGRPEAPLAWEGDRAGSHRTGVLTFKPVKPQPAAVELRLQRAGERAPRVFRWDLDCPCNDPKMHPQ